MLIGAFTKLQPREHKASDEIEEEDQAEVLLGPQLEVEDQAEVLLGPQLEEEEKVGSKGEDPILFDSEDEEPPGERGEDKEKLAEKKAPPLSGAPGSTEDVSWDAAKEEGEKISEDEGCEEREDPKIETIRVGVPIAGKTKEDVLSGVADLYLKLRIEGHYVHTVHTDQGREFVNRDLKAWLRARGIVHSTNSGEDPKANGRAERAVGEAKSRVRRLLHSAGMSVGWWPVALRFAMETDRLKRRGDSLRRIPGFGGGN